MLTGKGGGDMLLKILRADPAGNITVFVLDEVKPEMRADTASRLMAVPGLQAEQVGFLTAPRSPGSLCRLEMMGGEFCGNAARALGLYLAKKRGSGGRLAIEVSGCPHPIAVEADLGAETASAEMPLPKRTEPFILAGAECTMVALEGISHLVAECGAPDRRLIAAAGRLFGDDDSIAAYGAMFFDKYSMSMVPFVKVKATGSLIREGSCGSGTVAAAVSLCLGLKDGVKSFSISQPRGVVTARVEKRGGEFCAVSIGGSVSLGEETEIEV